MVLQEGRRTLKNQMATIGLGIVGYGYWGTNHTRVFDELPASTVVAVCDPSIARLEDAGRRYPNARLASTVDDLLHVDGVDAVAICTPATLHYEVARACIQAGKHVLVEKPLTTVSRESAELTRLADDAGVVLMVGHTFLFNHGIGKLRETIRSGEVGSIHYLYAQRTNLGPIRRDVNALWDLAPHDISVFNHLLDAEPEWVSAVGSRVLHNDREDVGFVTLNYPGDVLAHIHVSWSDPNKVRQIVVVGTRERILFNDIDTVEQVRIFERGVEALASDATPADVSATNFGEERLLVRDGDIRSPKLPVGEPLKRECDHFLECVRTGASPLSGGKEGAAVVRVMEAVDASLAQQGAPVRVAPAPRFTGSVRA